MAGRLAGYSGWWAFDPDSPMRIWPHACLARWLDGRLALRVNGLEPSSAIGTPGCGFKPTGSHGEYWMVWVPAHLADWPPARLPEWPIAKLVTKMERRWKSYGFRPTTRKSMADPWFFDSVAGWPGGRLPVWLFGQLRIWQEEAKAARADCIPS